MLGHRRLALVVDSPYKNRYSFIVCEERGTEKVKWLVQEQRTNSVHYYGVKKWYKILKWIEKLDKCVIFHWFNDTGWKTRV